MPKKNPKLAADAASDALKPVVEKLLDLGLTSPQAEALLRTAYVHAARRRLSQFLGLRQPPSDVRIALVTGIHRNFVRKILAAPPAIPTSRASRGASISRLISGWRTDATYVDEFGTPLDIAERDAEPSFSSLVKKYLPGVTAAVALAELRRTNKVKLISDHRLRLVRRRSKA